MTTCMYITVKSSRLFASSVYRFRDFTDSDCRNAKRREIRWNCLSNWNNLKHMHIDGKWNVVKKKKRKWWKLIKRKAKWVGRNDDERRRFDGNVEKPTSSQKNLNCYLFHRNTEHWFPCKLNIIGDMFDIGIMFSCCTSNYIWLLRRAANRVQDYCSARWEYFLQENPCNHNSCSDAVFYFVIGIITFSSQSTLIALFHLIPLLFFGMDFFFSARIYLLFYFIRLPKNKSFVFWKKSVVFDTHFLTQTTRKSKISYSSLWWFIQSMSKLRHFSFEIITNAN